MTAADETWATAPFLGLALMFIFASLPGMTGKKALLVHQAGLFCAWVAFFVYWYQLRTYLRRHPTAFIVLLVFKAALCIASVIIGEMPVAVAVLLCVSGPVYLLIKTRFMSANPRLEHREDSDESWATARFEDPEGHTGYLDQHYPRCRGQQPPSGHCRNLSGSTAETEVPTPPPSYGAT